MTKKVLISLEELKHLVNIAACQDDGLRSFIVWEIFDKLPPAPQWVSVEDGLPVYDQKVFVYDGYNKCVFQAALTQAETANDNDYWVEVEEGSIILNTVTHWMPIPELPEVKE